MDNTQVIKSTEEYFNEFYFIVFSPNPNKNNVKVIIDDGTIRLYMNSDKFVKIIETTMNLNVSLLVKNYCNTYGGFFLIDRVEGTVEKLQNLQEKEKLNLKELHADSIKEFEKTQNSDDNKLREKYLSSLNDVLDKEMFKNSGNANRFSSTIIYGQQGIRKYRP